MTKNEFLKEIRDWFFFGFVLGSNSGGFGSTGQATGGGQFGTFNSGSSGMQATGSQFGASGQLNLGGNNPNAVSVFGGKNFQPKYAEKNVKNSIDWLIVRSFDRLIDRSFVWSIDWSFDQSIDWLIDWLIDQMINNGLYS